MSPGRGPPPYQVASWSIQPFGHNTPTLQTDRISSRITGEPSKNCHAYKAQSTLQSKVNFYGWLLTDITVFGRPFAKRFTLCYCPVCNVDVLWLNGWVYQDATWYGGSPRPRTHCVRWGLSSPTERGTTAPTFAVYGRRLNRGPCLLWPNGWMDQDATWYRGRSRTMRHCFRWGTQLPHGEAQQPPLFGPCLLWPNGRPSQQLSCCLNLQLVVKWLRYQQTTANVYDVRYFKCVLVLNTYNETSLYFFFLCI